MFNVTIEEAQAKLGELIERLAPGEELTITRDDRPVATLAVPNAGSPRPIFGRGRGKVVVLADDDDHLDGFEDSRLLP